MAEIDPLDRLVQLARQEEPPPCGEADAAMNRIRALRGVRPAARLAGWKRPALVLAAAAAVAIIAVLLAVRTGKVAPAPGTGGDRDIVVRTPVQSSTNPATSASDLVPALDILGSMETEVDQLMSSAQSQQSATAKS